MNSSGFRRPRYVNDQRTQGDLPCNEAALRSSIRYFSFQASSRKTTRGLRGFEKLHPEGKFGISERSA